MDACNPWKPQDTETGYWVPAFHHGKNLSSLKGTMQVHIAETLKELTKKAPKTPINIQPRMSLAVCWPKGSTLQ
jgi:hypothetical protein